MWRDLNKPDEIARARSMIELLGLFPALPPNSVPIRVSCIHLTETLGESEFFGLCSFLQVNPQQFWKILTEYDFHFDPNALKEMTVRRVEVKQ